MSLIIENGLIVTGANSYASVETAKTWATARGLTFTGTDAQIEGLLLMAMDLVESFRDRFKGTKVDEAQTLQWPREEVYLDGYELDDDAIPQELISAQIQLAYDAQTTTLQPTGDGREVIREKVDVLETQYAERGAGTIQPRFNKAMAFLRPLFKNSGVTGTLRV